MKLRQKMNFKSILLCMMLIVAMAFCAFGCKKDDDKNTTTPVSQESNESSDKTVLGEGATQFDFVVVDKDGKETKFEIHTNQTVVGTALQELGLIEGENGAYGLYVKKVNGITADYDVDKTYWAFYINGEYAMSGVYVTNITAGANYSFKVEK